MKKALIIVLLLLLVHMSSAELSPVPCEDWYDFGSVEVVVSVDRPSYSEGETILIRATALNTNPFPIVEGSIRAHIIYLDGEEEYILDEFYIESDVNLLPDESIDAQTEWQLPESAKAGTYRVAVYFITSDSFNLAGVSFLRGIYSWMTDFEVGGGSDLLYFDTAKLKMNGEPHNLHELSPSYDQSTPVEVTIPIKNEGAATEATLTYELYSWDDLMGEDLLDEHTREETIHLASGQSRGLTFTLPGTVPADAYLLKITATSPKNDAILKVRIPILGKSVKLNFAGLDKFPLTAGEPVTLFLCVSNSAEPGVYFSEDEEPDAGWIKDGELKLALEADGKTIFEDSSSGLSIGGPMLGYEVEFTPDADYRRVTLKAEAEDEDGNVDAADIIYEFEKLFKEIDVSLDASVEGSTVTASVSLKKAGYPTGALVKIYAMNEDGAVVYVEPDVLVSDTYETAFALEPGRYTIKAVELENWNDAEVEVEIAGRVAPAKPKPPPAKRDNTVLFIVLIILIFMAALFYAYLKKDKRKGKRKK